LGAARGIVKFNPYHDPSNGQFTTAENAGAPGHDTQASGERTATPDGHKIDRKIAGQMLRRGWTPDAIDDAVRNGSRIDATNKKTGAPATRYVNPKSGASVVIDNTTDEIIQVGEPNFVHSPGSGDVPGAVMRPPPGPGQDASARPAPDSAIAPKLPPVELEELPIIPPRPIILPP
jgi:hypothetical protein